MFVPHGQLSVLRRLVERVVHTWHAVAIIATFGLNAARVVNSSVQDGDRHPCEQI